ncbi:WG repeat protein [Rahnella sp. BIGb0236]|uniref:WG repeat-containing protein n=1 Tax=Rahnella sp. BIGb0236 TaxID=2485117 RepID=UPI001060D717|nr:WG repeat-containing protein [Rahnella sp. BIGb0236]TDS96536.1 WG repeat protein [Rahnella sp. BIGb0236]
MNCSEKFKYLRNFSALSLVLNAFFSLPVHADDALLRACGNAKTAKDCQLPFQQGLSPVQMGLSREPLWGYVDTTGHMVIKPDFSEVRGFANDLAAAKKGDKFGYIDKKGHWVIEPRFTRATDFNAQGTALVVTDNRLALIDRKGAVVKTLPFAVSLDSQGFVGGQALASVQTQVSPALWNASTDSSLSLPDDVMAIDLPQSGLIPAKKRDASDEGYWGYLDENGEWAIDPMILKTRDEPQLGGDVVAVKTKNVWAFVDRQGVSLSKEQYKSVRPLASGSWLVTAGDNSKQLLNSKLEKVQDIPQDQSENLLVWGKATLGTGSKGIVIIGADNQIASLKVNKPQILQQGNRLWVMQTEGKTPQVAQVYDNNGVALLSDATLTALKDYQLQPLDTLPLTDDLGTLPEASSDATHSLPWAVLTPTDNTKPPAILTSQGNVLSDPQWASVEGNTTQAPLIIHTEDKKVGAVDAAGKWVIQPVYTQISPFNGDYTWAVENNGTADTTRLIDRNGNAVDVPANIQKSAQRLSSGLVFYTEGEKDTLRWGLWDIASKSIKAAPQFIQVESFNDGYALAQTEAGWGVIGTDGSWAIAPEASRSGKFQYIGQGMFTLSDNDQPGERGALASHYSLYSAENGQVIASDLLSRPQLVGQNHWLVQPSQGGVALLDRTGRFPVSKAIVASSSSVQGDRVMLGFSPHFGAINAQGDWQIQPLYTAAFHFIAPLNLSRAVSDGRTMLINDHGAVPLDGFEQAQPLNSLARLVMNDDVTGETVLYDNDGNEIQRFAGPDSLLADKASSGVIPMRDNKGLYGFVDQQGKKMIGSYFDQVGAMNNNFATAMKKSTYGNLLGYINTTGRFAILPKFDWAGDFSEKHAWAGGKGVVSLLNAEGGVQAKIQVRCNQRVIVDAKGAYLWPAKAPACGTGGN